MVVSGVVAVMLAAMVQGGYYPRIYLPAAIILLIAILLKGKHKQRKDNLLAVMWILLILTYFFSMIYYGCELCGWYQVGYIISVGICWLYATGLSEREKQKMYFAFLKIGISECLVGMAAYLGLPLRGIVANQRFMGTFQYANATALFLAMLLILSIGIETEWKEAEKLSGIRILLTVFLQLTFSVGGLLCFALGIIICNRKKKDTLLWWSSEFVVSGLFAGALYMAAFFRGGSVWGMGMVCCVMVFICLICVSRVHDILGVLSTKRQGILATYLIFLTELAGVVITVGQRSMATAMERILQMLDGGKILWKNMLFGIKPGDVLNELQKLGVSYKVTRIHNSYLQIGIEAGIFAVVLVIALLFVAGRKIYCGQNIPLWKKAVFSMIMIHFAVDVTYYFWAVTAMAIICLSETEMKRCKKNRK